MSSIESPLMDSELWSARIAAAKRQFNLQHLHHDHRLNIDDFEVVEDDIRPDISCPYCYEDFDFVSFCTHLEDEHSCESIPTVCPICSVKVARDMLSHITLQHANLFKLHRRRRLRKVAIPNTQAISMLGRDLREAHLQVLLGGGGLRSTNMPASVSATDQFLSSLALNFPGFEVDEISKSISSSVEDTTLKNSSSSSTQYRKPSFDSSLSYEERQRRTKQAAGRAGFLQDLLFCTLLED